MRALAILIVAFLSAAALPPPEASATSSRVALVVGVAAYESVPPLKNTANDARLVGETLARLGFEVDLMIDPGADDLRRAVGDFGFRAETADLALVYFAGHGVEIAGENYMLPADLRVGSRAEILAQSLSLAELLEAVDRARRLRIVVLDSCRDNPFAGLPEFADAAAITGGPGLVEMAAAGLAAPSPERGTLVAYAAKDGEAAFDGAGDNSPFALALVEHIDTPGLEIGMMFRRVRDSVMRATANLQEPHTYGSLSGVPVFLAGGAPLGDAVDPREAWARLRPDQEAQLVALAQAGDTRGMLGLAYIRQTPQDPRYDPVEAAAFLKRAAAAGSAEAQFELGKAYEQGIGVEPDPSEALAWYRRAADQGFADAINDLGFLYFQGGLGLPTDPKRAVALFERAADLRHPEAMFNFAALIDDGIVAGKAPRDAALYLYGALRSGNSAVLRQLSESPTMFKTQTRVALQEILAENGFYDGSIDGAFGPATRRSLAIAYGATVE